MTQLIYTDTLQNGQLADASIVEAKFQQAANVINGELEKDNVSGGGWRFDDVLSGPTGLAVCSFLATLTVGQPIAAGVRNTVVFDTEKFDLSGAYNSANGRFQPSVSGIYRVSTFVEWGAFTGYAQTSVYKNGALHVKLSQGAIDPTTAGSGLGGSTLVSLNGSTDFVDIEALNGSGSSQNVVGGFFCAELVGRN